MNAIIGLEPLVRQMILVPASQGIVVLVEVKRFKGRGDNPAIAKRHVRPVPMTRRRFLDFRPYVCEIAAVSANHTRHFTEIPMQDEFLLAA
jgi:hypothetical protein